MRRLIVIGCVALMTVAAPGAAVAAACPRTSVGALEDEVMCQVCGVPLSLAADAPQARRERAFIARLVAQCQSESQIKDALVAQYGPSVLADPPNRGFDMTAHVVPVLAVGLAAAGLGALGLAWRRRDPAAQPQPAPLSASDRARVDAALERWRP